MPQEYDLYQHHVAIEVPEGKCVYLSRFHRANNPETVEWRRFNVQTGRWQNKPPFVLERDEDVLDTGIEGEATISMRFVQGSIEHGRFVRATVKTPG
jgi:hypothetical protein